MSAGALAALPTSAIAQTVCVTGGLPAFLPTRLTVDCASRRNYAIYRKNVGYMGLTGAVSMTTVRGRYGIYEAGNLFLFPWLKPKGQAFGPTKAWGTVLPVSATQMISMAPIKDATLPQDEYLCNYLLQVPGNAFIGCLVDVPYAGMDAKFPWFTNVKLADASVGIDWTSSNLNNGWFGGSRTIPSTADCNGGQWRKLIVDGLNQASAAIC